MIDDKKMHVVKNYLTGGGITSVPLGEDLLDHFCCSIERQMEAGASFECSFEKAIEQITPNGPSEIQKDFNYLKTIKTNTMLRKLVYTLSYLSVLIVLLGVALRIPQIVSSDLTLLLMMVGLLLFSVSAVPFYFYQRYQQSIQDLQKV